MMSTNALPLFKSFETPNKIVHPWRRYFARMLDTFLNSIAFWFFLGFPLYFYDENLFENFSAFIDRTPRIVDAMLTAIISIFINAISFGLTGRTIGKWLFGIRIVDEHEKSIGFWSALKRELAIWMKGLGFGIPIAALFTLCAAHKKLIRDGHTSWDKKLNLQIIYRTKRQGFFGICGAIILISMLALHFHTLIH